MKNIPEILRNIREKMGLSQGEFAKRLNNGFVQQDVHRYENAKRGVPFEYIARVCEVFAIDINSFTQKNVETAADLTLNNVNIDKESGIYEQLIVFKTESRIYKELHQEHLETERNFIQKVEAVLLNCEGLLQKTNIEGNKSPVVKTKQTTGVP
jgi:transcriptional regulator with XRE-family HTH domain